MIRNRLDSLARYLQSDYDSLPETTQNQFLVELTGIIVSIPLVFVGLIWLISLSDWSLLRDEWPAFLFFLIIAILLGRLSFFQILGDIAGDFDYNTSNLADVVTTSAIFIFGPTAVWLVILQSLAYHLGIKRNLLTPAEYRNWLRNMLFNLWANPIAVLMGLLVYEGLGGRFPLSDLALQSSWPAFVAVAVILILNVIFFQFLVFIWIRLIWYPEGGVRNEDKRRGLEAARFLLVTQSPSFFGIFGAILYVDIGVSAFLFFIAGVFLVSFLARRLSQAVMVSDQRTREVTQLEHLSRALLAAPSDASTLPDILAAYVPRMFDYVQAEIHLFSGQTLLQLPENLAPLNKNVWSWLRDNPKAVRVPAGHPIPWTGQTGSNVISIIPILSSETSEPIGGICLLQGQRVFAQPPADVHAPLQSLADQIALALHGAEVYRRDLIQERIAQELAVAGRIQASFLPPELPPLTGWGLAATLQPARETAGDFYDVFELPDSRIGLIVADVADKGMGAALYMAVSRTLLRIYSSENQGQPDIVLQETNRRLLADTQADLFVSVFYGVLDPITGRLIYANAGHNPPIHLSSQGDQPVRHLNPTGMIAGVLEEAEWGTETIMLCPGDMLVAFSDGVIDAQNDDGDFFEEQRLQVLVENSWGNPAQKVQEDLLSQIGQFVGDAPQFDDITLLVLTRKHL